MASATPNVVIPEDVDPALHKEILRTDNLPPGCVPHPKNPQLCINASGRPQFRKGNRTGSGESPLNRQQMKLRMALAVSVTPSDIMEIMVTLIEAARNGNITAAREVLDRAVGKTDESIVVKRLEELERAILEGRIVVKDSKNDASANDLVADVSRYGKQAEDELRNGAEGNLD